MDSNKHGIMEQNEEHIIMNNLIYHTHETELRMRSYDMLNMAKKYIRQMTWWKMDLSEIDLGFFGST